MNPDDDQQQETEADDDLVEQSDVESRHGSTSTEASSVPQARVGADRLPDPALALPALLRRLSAVGLKPECIQVRLAHMETQSYGSVSQRIQLEGPGPADHLTEPVGANWNTVIGGIAGKNASLGVQELGPQLPLDVGIHEQRSPWQPQSLSRDRSRFPGRVMVETLRRVGLAGKELAWAQSWTLRGKLLKIGAQVRVTTRKVWLSFSKSYPYAVLLRTVLARVQALPLRC